MATILIVDDTAQTLEPLTLHLQREGHTILTAKDGNTAIDVTTRQHPDLILLDMLMPGEGGIQFLTWLRATPEVANTKVIVMSNLESENIIAKAKELGADDYFIKAEMSLDEVSQVITSKL